MLLDGKALPAAPLVDLAAVVRVGPDHARARLEPTARAVEQEGPLARARLADGAVSVPVGQLRVEDRPALLAHLLGELRREALAPLRVVA